MGSTGIIVASLTFDGAASNITMAECLGAQLRDVNNLKLSFLHPVTQEPIFIIFDACHAIKLVHNALTDKKVIYDGDENNIKWNHIQQLVYYQHKYGLHPATKIGKRHINFKRKK